MEMCKDLVDISNMFFKGIAINQDVIKVNDAEKMR